MIKERDISQKYVGIPYKHEGRDPAEGLDCWGLILAVYKDLGIKLMDLSGYAEDWSDTGANYFVENYADQWKRVEIPRLYDIVLFRTDSKKNPNHAGLYLGDAKFIQCVKLGVIVSRLNANRFKGSIEGFFRFKGLDA